MLIRIKKYSKNLFENIGLILLVLIFIIPFAWMVGTSLKSYSEAMSPSLKFFGENLLFSNYVQIFFDMNYLHYFLNSLILATLVVVGRIIVCLPAAYVLAQKQFRFKKIIFGLLLLNLLIPAQIVFLPIYKLISKLNLLDTFIGMGIIHFYSAYSILFLYQIIKKIPTEIVEAARLDNATEWRIIKNLIIPYVKPMLITIGVFTFVDSWNDYFWPFLLTTSNQMRTLPVALRAMTEVTDGIKQWQLIMAANVLVLLPILVIYIFANKKIKNAFAYDGIK